jgi:3-hydroxyisobutyrate dehydrogenase|tara:strand:- start:318 stop:1181 length:864 start_codon:yes stop_codon:yes gene_type:complete
MTNNVYGFIGLGNMGAAMCSNLTKSGIEIVCYDVAGTAERAPAGARVANNILDVAMGADTIFLSLPDGPIVIDVTQEIGKIVNRKCQTIVDLSTTGPETSVKVGSSLALENIIFIDAPVSGGKSGAIAATLALMCSGPDDSIENLTEVFNIIAGNVIQVGQHPGQAQAMKLLNNFLSATAMAATSEATIFGLSHGLEMETILSVLNVSSGRNTSTEDKFPKRVLSGTFDAGFSTLLMSKDVSLYHEQVMKAKTPNSIVNAVSSLWKETNSALPNSDFTEIYRYLSEA